MKITIRLALLLLLPLSLFAQNQPRTSQLATKALEGDIEIDGRLTEEIWEKLPRASGFYQNFPVDNEPAIDDTEFMVTYNEQMIIIGIKCYDGLPGEPIATTLRRDFNWGSNDNVSVYLDPYNDFSNGFSFQVTPNNVQREGLVLLDGDVRDDWDNKWYSEVYKGDGFWSVEIAIPFKSIRYNSIDQWNIQVLRNNLKRNERTSWIRVPQGFRQSNLTFSGKLLWDKPPQKAGTNLVLIPYLAGGVAKNHEDDHATETNFDAGFDAKVALTSSLNLDLTFNPDFSQVEVDRQVTNLQRFEINFPERRQFFLENQDLFAEAGFNRSSNPFFSRRIGIRSGGAVPITGGARVSGKLGKNWRIGALNMLTKEVTDEDEIVPAQSYSVAVVERQLFQRSRLSAIFVGRTNLGRAFVEHDTTALRDTGVLRDQFGNELIAEDTLSVFSEYNYVYGLDFNLATNDSRWEGDFFYHRSLDPVQLDNQYAAGGFLRYQIPSFGIRASMQSIGENHNAEVGFIPRKGITRIGAGVDVNFFTDGPIQRHGPRINTGNFVDSNWDRLDNDAGIEYRFSFLNTAYAEVGARWNYVTLTADFDPSGSDGLELVEGTAHQWYRYRLFYRSDRRKNFIYRIDMSNGGFYNGNRLNLGGGLTFRFPPIVEVELNGEYNRVDLPDPYNDSKLFLLGPRIDLTLTNKLFFTTFIQYNTQAENLGHNSRFQWRFKPVSDLFIVYTDNYVTTDFTTRNRAIVVKLNYWLNL